MNSSLKILAALVITSVAFYAGYRGLQHLQEAERTAKVIRACTIAVEKHLQAPRNEIDKGASAGFPGGWEAFKKGARSGELRFCMGVNGYVQDPDLTAAHKQDNPNDPASFWRKCDAVSPDVVIASKCWVRNTAEMRERLIPKSIEDKAQEAFPGLAQETLNRITRTCWYVAKNGAERYPAGITTEGRTVEQQIRVDCMLGAGYSATILKYDPKEDLTRLNPVCLNDDPETVIKSECWGGSGVTHSRRVENEFLNQRATEAHVYDNILGEDRHEDGR